MTNQELAAEMIGDHAVTYYATQKKDYATANMILNKVLVNAPKAAELLRAEGLITKDMAAEDWDPEAREAETLLGEHFIQKAAEMGVGKPLTEDYWKDVLKKNTKTEESWAGI
jgi:hypothetical protein